MYSEKIVDRHIAYAKDSLGLDLVRYDDSNLDDLTFHLAGLVKAYDKDGVPSEWHRQPTQQEWDYINNERLMCKFDVRYFAGRYGYIQLAALPGITPRVDRLGSVGFMRPQEVFLTKLAKSEEAMYDAFDRGETVDGLRYFINKGRQLHFTALSRILSNHRTFFWPDTLAIGASVNEDMVGELYDRDKLMFTHLPWFLRPHTKFDVKNQQLAFDPLNSGTIYHQANQHGGMGMGRGQLKSAKILTPTGWTTFGQVKVGDSVLGQDGQPHSVTGVYPRGVQPSFKVTFSDGSSTVCDSSHLWSVQTPKMCSRKQGFKTVSTGAIAAGALLQDSQGNHQLFIPMVAPADFVVKDAPPLHPYLVGLLLGDGGISQHTVNLYMMDDMSFIQSYLPAGTKLTRRASGTCDNWRITKTSGVRNPVKDALENLGLMGKTAPEKFIPSRYMFGTIDERIQVLQGLIDTDGHIDKNGNIEFITVSSKLAEDVKTLIQSLGGLARIFEKQGMITLGGPPRSTRMAYRVRIRVGNNIIPAKLARKVARLKPRVKYFPKRCMVSVEPIAPQETVCISVSAPDQLYVTNEFIVTHNSIQVAHMTECAFWDDMVSAGTLAEKLDFHLFPAIPQSPTTLYILESTSNGIGGWWWEKIQQIIKGKSLFQLFFCPWYAADKKYRRTPPQSWQPSDYVLNMADQAERTSSTYLGFTVQLEREQLYWYETTMAEHDRRLGVFLSNYPTTLSEAFQSFRDAAFSVETLAKLRNGIGRLHGVYDLVTAG